MRKLNIIFILIFALFSCEKENNLPPEYYSILGSWSIDSLYSIEYNRSITINKNSIIFYIENTPTQKITNYIDVKADTISYSNGETLVDFYFIYKNEMGGKRSTSLSYDFKNDIIHMGYRLYDSGTYYGEGYSFYFRRN